MASTNPLSLLEDRCYFAIQDTKATLEDVYTCVEMEPYLEYEPFFADFGPIHLGRTVSFCKHLKLTMEASAKPVCLVIPSHPQQVANSIVMLCAYLILFEDKTPFQALTPFFALPPPIPFRDAAFTVCTYQMTIIDCAKAFFKAKALGHMDIRTFSEQEFNRLAQLDHGDISWIIPNKLIAFSGPLEQRVEFDLDRFTLTAEDYVPIFQQLGVTCVVRFNKKCYDRRHFLNNGIRHVDLYYEDGTTPSDDILANFLRICDEEATVAVHCKAGLGRTGTNIAAYMMKTYGYTAREATAWHRICRPGSVVGPQQHYLLSIEKRMKEASKTATPRRKSKESRFHSPIRLRSSKRKT